MKLGFNEYINKVHRRYYIRIKLMCFPNMFPILRGIIDSWERLIWFRSIFHQRR